MTIKIHLIIHALLLLGFTKCNKSGFVRNINEKLSNGNDYWKLVKYEVNGIDSTELINYGNYPGFKEHFLRALLHSKNAGTPACTNGFFSLFVEFRDRESIFSVQGTRAHPRSLQGDTCKHLNPQTCQRNAFFPEGRNTDWKIKRLNSRKFILTCQQTNNYYLEMASGK